MPTPSYLGDSVYATYDGYGVEIFCNNGETRLSGSSQREIIRKNPIYLEPETVAALVLFLQNQQEKQNQNQKTT